MKMKTTDIIKMVVGGIITVGVEVIVESTLMLVMPKSTGILKRAAVSVGSWAIALAISSTAQDYADIAVDLVDDAIKNIKVIIKVKEVENS
jgi:hypothetical protein